MKTKTIFTRSIKHKLAGIFTVSIILLVAVFSSAVYFFYKNSVKNTLNDSVDQQIITYTALIDSGDDVKTQLIHNAQTSDPWYYTLIEDATGVIFSNTHRISPDIIQEIAEKWTYHAHGYLFKSGIKWGYTIVIGVSEAARDSSLDYLLSLLITISIILAGATFIGGRKVISYFLTPLQKITTDISEYGTKWTDVSLHTRYNSDDEVWQLAIAFDKLMSSIREASDREKEFMQDISHELRTPLTGMKTTLELLENNPSVPKEEYQILRDSCQRMETLVNQFLFLGRIHKYDEQHSCHLDEIVKKILALHQPLIEKKSLTIEVKNEWTSPLTANPLLLETLIGNLLSNAIAYTDTGTITMTLTPHAFTIIDTGRGIPADQQSKIRQRLHRWDPSRSEEGFGLWLAIVKKICDLYGRDIYLESAEKKGTTFTVVFLKRA